MISAIMDARQQKGYNIFKTNKIGFDKKKNGWIVPSQSSNKKYFVSHDFDCNCPGLSIQTDNL